MLKGVKVALPGVNADESTDPKDFSLYVDGTEDHILVKEKSRGTQSVNASSTATINHALGYIPFNMQCVEISAGEFEWVYNAFGGAFNPYYSYVTTANLVLGNQDGSSKTFSHIVFYDQL